MSFYEFLLFVHVLAAAAWFGAALLSVVLMELAGRAQHTAWLVRFGEYDDTLAKVLFIPSALLVLIAGVALVFEGPWSFTDDGWVLAGLLLFATIFAVGLGTIREEACRPRRVGSPASGGTWPAPEAAPAELARCRPARRRGVRHDNQAVLRRGS